MTQVYDRILAPTDGSDAAATAVEHAGRLAATFDATVTVLHAVESWNLERYDDEEDTRIGRAKELVESAAEPATAAGASVETAVDVGPVHEVVLEHAADCDLVVMGTQGRSGVSRMLLGSVTEKVVRLSETPVLTVRRPDEGTVAYPYERILLPTDASDGVAAAVEQAAALAAAHDATLHVVSVVDERTFQYGTDIGPLREALDERAWTAVEAAAETAEAAGASVETAVVSGTPHRRLREYVDDHGLDLVVMGTHGRTRLERYLLGSVAERMLRTSPAPVMTVRAPREG